MCWGLAQIAQSALAVQCLSASGLVPSLSAARGDAVHGLGVNLHNADYFFVC